MIINQTRLKYKIKDQVRDQVYGQVDIKVDDDVWCQIWYKTCREIQHQIYIRVGDQVLNTMGQIDENF